MSKGWGDPESGSGRPEDGYGSEDEKFIPMADYEHMKQQFFEERERKLKALDERDQLREALDKIQGGIHKASDETIQLQGRMMVKAETWRQCRELGMDLLHVPMGGEEIELVLEFKDGYLSKIEHKK